MQGVCQWYHKKLHAFKLAERLLQVDRFLLIPLIQKFKGGLQSTSLNEAAKIFELLP
jgi:hypothetical protein